MATISRQICVSRCAVRGVSAGSNDMNRICAGLAMAALSGWAFVATANAAPPTATPSPGYDARLQEQRAVRATYEPAMRVSGPVHRHRAKRIHGAR
jgi:hypothetical protein